MSRVSEMFGNPEHVGDTDKLPHTLTTEEVRARFLEEPQYWVNVKGDDWVPERTKKDFDLWLIQERQRVAEMAIKKERRRAMKIIMTNIGEIVWQVKYNSETDAIDMTKIYKAIMGETE